MVLRGERKTKGQAESAAYNSPPEFKQPFLWEEKSKTISEKKRATTNHRQGAAPPRDTAKGHHQGAPPPRGTTTNNNNNNNNPFLNPFYKELLIPLLGCCACLGCCGCLDGLCELAVWLGIIKGSPNCKPDLLGSTTSQCGFSTRPRSSWSPGPGQKLPPPQQPLHANCANRQGAE